MVFSAGNDGQGTAAEGQPRGSSNCIDGGTSGTCAISLQGSAPWTVMVAAGAQVGAGGPGDQHLDTDSSRGDPRPHRVRGVDVTYMPTLTAPGEQIVSTATSAAAARCVVVTCPGGLIDPLYALMGGTSMAVPHVVGAVALLQSAARAKLGRELTPDEVKQLLVQGAAPMMQPFDEPGTCNRYTGPATGCDPGMCSIASEAMGCKPAKPTGRYQRWQVGAGYLDVPATLKALDRLAHPPVPEPPAPPAPPVAAAPPASTAPPPAQPRSSSVTPRKPAAKKRKAAKRKAASCKKKMRKARGRKTRKCPKKSRTRKASTSRKAAKKRSSSKRR
jgi:hypothetical protein